MVEHNTKKKPTIGSLQIPYRQSQTVNRSDLPGQSEHQQRWKRKKGNQDGMTKIWHDWTVWSYRATQGCCCSTSKMDSVFSQTQDTNSAKANRISTPTHGNAKQIMHSVVIHEWCLPSEGMLPTSLKYVPNTDIVLESIYLVQCKMAKGIANNFTTGRRRTSAKSFPLWFSLLPSPPLLSQTHTWEHSVSAAMASPYPMAMPVTLTNWKKKMKSKVWEMNKHFLALC